MTKTNNDTNKTINIKRSLNVPVGLVWKAWSQPEDIAQWWGPDGFSSTIHLMEFREGGEWKLTIHGPGGTNYPNRSIFKEIIPLKKIVFEHFNPHFNTTVLFEPKGEETLVDWTMEFDTAEMRETIVKAHKADEGQKQNMKKLEQYLNIKYRQHEQ